MSTESMNGHAPRGHTRPRTLAAQTPREQVDEALAKTVAGEMPEIPPFLKEAAKEPRTDKGPARSRTKDGAIKNPPDAKKNAKPPVARNLEPAGRELLKQQQKAKEKKAKAKAGAKAASVQALREARAAKAGGAKAPKANKPNGAPGPKLLADKLPPVGAKAKAKPEAAPADGKKTKVQIVAELLRRPGGCTAADVLSATGWPAVSMPQQAKAAGITLLKEKEAGKPTRYCAG